MSRVGLGCMRLSTDPDRDLDRAAATIEAALDAGVVWLDTARSYGADAGDLGHGERLLASVLAKRPTASVRIVTKCGMARPEGSWKPDGRAASIVADARASALALGRPPDVLLLHAPDPAVALATSVRALLRARADGLARAVGLSNVTRGQLDALEREPSLRSGGAPLELAAVEVALGVYDDAAARGGVLAWCKERGVAVLAHSPFGGPSRAARVARDATLRAVAQRRSASPAQVALAYLLAVDGAIVPLPGARRPETATSAIAAGAIILEAEDLAALDERFPGLGTTRRPPKAPSIAEASAEIVMVMGLAGSGKTRLAEAYVERGYERLNRDTLGGTLRGLARRLEERLAAGAKRLVLDNTYVTRASRSEVLRVAHAARAVVRCVHVDAALADAQVNATWRMLERHGELLGGVDLVRRSKGDANLFAPTALSRMERQLERPSLDEGFVSLEVVPFVRDHAGGHAGTAVPLELLVDGRPEPSLRVEAAGIARLVPDEGPVLVFGWRPSADPSWVARALAQARRAFAFDRAIGIGVCAHPGGPPVCWCRPPLPGLWLDFARRRGVDPRRSRLIAGTRVHRTMAQTLGLSAIDASVREIA